MLGYLDLRFANEQWLEGYTQFQKWARRANESEIAKTTH